MGAKEAPLGLTAHTLLSAVWLLRSRQAPRAGGREPCSARRPRRGCLGGSPLSRSHPQLSTRIPSHGDTPSMYCEAKRGACTYQSVKQQLFKAFQKAGLGTWVRKPPEQDQFQLTL